VGGIVDDLGNDSTTSATSFRRWLGLGQAADLYHVVVIIVGNYRKPLCTEEESADGVVVECCCLERGWTGGVTLPAGEERGLLWGREALRR